MVKETARPLRSGEAARRAGVSSDTLRFYERRGLLPNALRAPNGYRMYPAETPAQVTLIQRALALGFSTEELARILRARRAGQAPCHTVRALAEEKLQLLEQRLADLHALRRELRGILRRWDARLRRTKAGQRAHLLAALGPSERRWPRSLSPHSASRKEPVR